MPVSNSQYANEFDEIRKKFSSSQYITIAAGNGTPPDSCEIVYLVRSVTRLDKGEAVVADRHRVSIALPFGYPHFPPNCKALTPVFHPDFDPDAICIGDFWNTSQSLVELVVHIGRLISYQHYSSEDVFNPEALAWAAANSELLPLDTADFTLPQLGDQSNIIGEDVSSPSLTSSGADEHPPALSSAPGAGVEKAKEKRGTDSPKAGMRIESKNRKPLLVAVGGVFILAAVTALLFMFDMRNFAGAARKWGEVAPLIDANRYPEADALVKEAIALLDKVFLFKKREKEALLQEVAKLTDSREYLEGLQGRMLVNGRYIPIRQQQDVLEVTELLSRAQDMVNAGDWRQSGELYARAVEKTAALGDTAPVSLDEVQSLAKQSLLREQVRQGNLFRSQQKWDEARSSYLEAMKIFSEIKSDEQMEITENEIRTRLNEMAFYSAIERGNHFLADKQWLQAMESYEAALKLANELEGDAAREVKKTEGQRAVAGFSFYHEEGMKRFAEGKWDEAITGLSRGEGLLDAAQAAGGAQGITRKSIAMKILTATIKRAEAAVAACLAEEKYLHAVKILKAQINAINQSRLGSEPEFTAAAKSATARIGRYEFLQDIQQKIVYLTSRYETIFKEFFPSVARSKLSDPQVAFLRQEGSLLLFRMQCLEENRRQKFTLEMNYQYDSRSGQWSPGSQTGSAGQGKK